MPDEESRPPWLTTLPGKHPAERNPIATPEEIVRWQRQAEAIGSLVARADATEGQKFLVDSQTRELSARVNYIALFQNPEARETYRQILVQSIRDQGRFAEARALATPGETEEIDWWEWAVWRDDAECCDCVRPVLNLPVGGGKTEQRTGDRHIQYHMVMSPKHGVVVWLWKCTCPECRCLNAKHEVPEHQVELMATRKLTQQIGAGLDKKGWQAFTDLQVLKKN